MRVTRGSLGAYTWLLLLGGSGCAPASGGVVATVAQEIQEGVVDTSTPENNAVVRIDPILCSGTLITSDWVLTAAHCVDAFDTAPGSTWVRIGLDTSSSAMPTAARVDVDRCFAHPHAGAGPTPWRCDTIPAGTYGSFERDLALLHLVTPVSRAVARPMRVLLHNPAGTYSAWVGRSVTLRGWGRTGPFGGPYTLGTVRHRGTNQLDPMPLSVPQDFSWNASRDPTGTDSLTMMGDSGGPLIWEETAGVPTLIGVSSGGDFEGALWANTTVSAGATWINSVMTHGTDASAQVTTGSAAPPRNGWLGEGADAPSGDNCPNLFNPWQNDSDNDGVGNDCDTTLADSNVWGAAHFNWDGSRFAQFNPSGAPITATMTSTGVYTIAMRQLRHENSNVQVVATGYGAARCKLAGWSESSVIDNFEEVTVRCFDHTGALTPSSFIVYFNHGASPQVGAHLLYTGSAMTPVTRKWHSSNPTNPPLTVNRTALGKYTVFYYLPTNNLAVHVTAVGTGSEHCNVEYSTTNQAGIACYSQAGTATDSAFSLMATTGSTRSGLVGGHVRVIGTTTAQAGFSFVQPSTLSTPLMSPSVASYASVTYPATLMPTDYPVFALTTAFGFGTATHCKIEGSSTSILGSSTVVSRCYALGSTTPINHNFIQSFLASSAPGP